MFFLCSWVKQGIISLPFQQEWGRIYEREGEWQGFMFFQFLLKVIFYVICHEFIMMYSIVPLFLASCISFSNSKNSASTTILVFADLLSHPVYIIVSELLYSQLLTIKPTKSSKLIQISFIFSLDEGKWLKYLDYLLEVFFVIHLKYNSVH